MGGETDDSCISFDSYIKPQQMDFNRLEAQSCISFDSYIKPQHTLNGATATGVVYLLIPTSNHNTATNRTKDELVVYLLIPTSNHNFVMRLYILHLLYIF